MEPSKYHDQLLSVCLVFSTGASIIQRNRLGQDFIVTYIITQESRQQTVLTSWWVPGRSSICNRKVVSSALLVTLNGIGRSRSFDTLRRPREAVKDLNSLRSYHLRSSKLCKYETTHSCDIQTESKYLHSSSSQRSGVRTITCSNLQCLISFSVLSLVTYQI